MQTPAQIEFEDVQNSPELQVAIDEHLAELRAVLAGSPRPASWSRGRHQTGGSRVHGQIAQSRQLMCLDAALQTPD